MKAAQQVQIIRQALLLREKNQYTQSSLRLLVNQGYSDCSSFVWWLYLSTLKLDIGMDTREQILSLQRAGRRLRQIGNSRHRPPESGRPSFL